MPNNSYVYTMQGTLSLAAGGSEQTYDLIDVRLVNQLNEPPMVAASVVLKSKDEASKFRLALFADVVKENDAMQTAVLNPAATANISITAESPTSGDAQSISLTSWLVIGAGVPKLSADGQYQAAVSLRHKSWLLCVYPSGVLNHAGIIDPPPVFDEGSIYDIFTSCLDYYLQSVTMPASSTDSSMEIVQKVHEVTLQKATAGLEALRATVKWAGVGNLLPDTEQNDYAEDLSLFFGDWLWQNMNDPMSPLYNTFLRDILSQLSLVTTSAVADTKTQIIPYAPWGKPVVTIYDTDIFSINTPQADTDPIAGVVSTFGPELVGSDPAINVVESETEQTSNTAAAAMAQAGYLDKLTAANSLYGRIAVLNPPTWIIAFKNFIANYGVTADEDKQGTKTGATMTDSLGDSDAPANPNSTEAGAAAAALATTWCKQMFYAMFRSSVQITVRCRLLLQKTLGNTELPSSQLCPGMVVAVRAKEDDSLLYAFYLQQVAHALSGGDCSTTLVGTHCRPGGGIPAAGITAEDVTGGIPNPLYNYNGELNINHGAVV